MINNADELKKYVESDDNEEFSKSRDSAPDEVWLEVINKHPELCSQVASNNTISALILEQLYLNESDAIPWDIAMKRRINRETFERLAKDPEPSVREIIACNPKVPRDILEELCKDPDPLVCNAANEKLNLKKSEL